MAALSMQDRRQVRDFYRTLLNCVDNNIALEAQTLPGWTKAQKYTEEFAKSVDESVTKLLPPNSRIISFNDKLYITFIDTDTTHVATCCAKFLFTLPLCPEITNEEVSDQLNHQKWYKNISNLKTYTFGRDVSYNTHLDMVLDLPIIETFCANGMKFPITAADGKRERVTLINDELRAVIENQIFKIRLENKIRLPVITNVRPFAWK